MGVARENILLQYKMFERHKEVAKASMENRQAIVAAGIYEDPITYLNEAAAKYSEMVYLNTQPEEITSAKPVSNQDLYEDWKRLFGKIDNPEPSSNE